MWGDTYIGGRGKFQVPAWFDTGLAGIGRAGAGGGVRWAGGTWSQPGAARVRGARTSQRVRWRTIRGTGEYESASLYDEHLSVESCEIWGLGRRAASRQRVANGGAHQTMRI